MCIDCDQPVDGTDGSDVRDCASDLCFLQCLQVSYFIHWVR